MYTYLARTIVIAGVAGCAVTALITGPLGVAIVVTPKLVTCLAAEIVVLSAISARAID